MSSSSSAFVPPGGLTLTLGHLRAEHEVAEHALLGFLVDQAGPQLVHGEGEHVGRPLLLHPLLVELGDGGLVDRLDAQLGERVDPHPLHHEPAQRGELGDVELVPGLVQHLDAHARSPTGLAGGLVGRVLAAGVELVVRRDDLADQPVPDHVVAGEPVEDDVSTPLRIPSTTRRPDLVPLGRSTWVTSPVTTILEPNPSRVRNIFICSGEVFCASSRMMNASLRVRPAHVGQRGDLDGAGRQQLGDRLGVDHVVQRVVERPQVGVDLLAEGAGRWPSRSPASTAGRVRMIRLTFFACSACTALAIAR